MKNIKLKTVNGIGWLIGHGRGRCVRMVPLAGLLLGLLGQPVTGQLAITEAMSSASTISPGVGLADFWELTNFGTNDISLAGFVWSDNQNHRINGGETNLSGLILSNREVILIVATNSVITNAQAFRDWWGASLPTRTRILVYGPRHGLSGNVDGIRLWGPGATNDADVIDSVDFGNARPGSSFTYDPVTGLFGYYSVTNVGGAFRSALYNDIGSPGVTSGEVPVQVLSQPASLEVCAGIDTAFSVLAGGFPRPRYRWLFNGAQVAGGTAPTLTIVNPQTNNAGTYQVEISGGTNVLFSTLVTLTVDATSRPPTVFTPFSDVQVLSNETARFFAPVCAYPLPTFQWRSNNVVIAGATNRTLVLRKCQPVISGARFCVDITNTLGGTSICARLTVLPKPNLVITEVMPAPSTTCVLLSTDWFEVTNFGSNAVNLLGYRLATGNNTPPSLEAARLVTNNAILQPGESAVFVRGYDVHRFIEWWGEALPPHLVLIPYSGVGLGGAPNTGDELYLWSPSTEDVADIITSVTWAIPVGGTSGVSLDYLDNFAGLGTYCPSVPGERGAFVAAQCGDIGSPGYTNNPPPRFSRIIHDAAGATLRWRSISNSTYQLSWKSDLNAANSTPLVTRTATNWVETYVDATATNAEPRFYLLEKLP